MRIVLATLVFLSGCTLYLGGDGDDAPCAYDAAGDVAAPSQQLRNPSNGECQSFGGGYPYPCDDRCGPCPAIAEAMPNWGSCGSECEALDEPRCLASASCQVAYLVNDGTQRFFGCWDTAEDLSGPISSCESLDANQCAMEAGCNLNYLGGDTDDVLRFSHCSGNTRCYNTGDCGPGQRCTVADEVCNDTGGQGPGVCTGVCYTPPPQSCATIDCGPGARCEEHCKSDGNGQIYCEPVCVQTTSCDLIDCAAGYHCAEVCTEPDPMDPNTPMCGTCTPQCVPDNQPAQCEAITDESACSARSECTPVYEGEDCTCYPDGCVCNVLTFERCQTR